MDYELPKRKRTINMKLARFLNWANLSYCVVTYNHREYFQLVSFNQNSNLVELESVYYNSVQEIFNDLFNVMQSIAFETIEKKHGIRFDNISNLLQYIESVNTDVINNDFYSFVYLLCNPNEIVSNCKLNPPKKFYKKKGKGVYQCQ